MHCHLLLLGESPLDWVVCEQVQNHPSAFPRVGRSLSVVLDCVPSHHPLKLQSGPSQQSHLCDILCVCVVSEGERRVCLAFLHHPILICQETFPLSGLPAVVREKKASSVGSLWLLRQKLNLEISLFLAMGLQKI